MTIYIYIYTRYSFVLSIYVLAQKAVLNLYFLIAAIKVVKGAHTAFTFSHIFRCENQIFTQYLALASFEVTLVQNLTYFAVLPNIMHGYGIAVI